MEDASGSIGYRYHIHQGFARDVTVNQSTLAESPSSHTTFPEYTPPPAAPNKSSESQRASQLPATNLRPFFAEVYGDGQDMLGSAQGRVTRSSVQEFRRMVEEDARATRTRGGYAEPTAASNGRAYDTNVDVHDVAPLGRAPMTYAAMENLSYGTSGIQSTVSPALTNETQPPRMAPVMDTSELYDDYSTSPVPNEHPQNEDPEDAHLRHPSRSTAAFPNTYSHSPSSGTLSPSPNATREKYNMILDEVRHLCELNNTSQQERVYWEETLKEREMQWSYDRERLQHDLSDTDAERRYLRMAVDGLQSQMKCLEMRSPAPAAVSEAATHPSVEAHVTTSETQGQSPADGTSRSSAQPRLDVAPVPSNTRPDHSNVTDVARLAIELLRIMCDKLGDMESGSLGPLNSITKEESSRSHNRSKRTSPSRYISPSSNDIHNPHFESVNRVPHERSGKKGVLESQTVDRAGQQDRFADAHRCGVKLGATLNKMEYWMLAGHQQEKMHGGLTKEELSRSAEAGVRDFVAAWNEALQRAATASNTERKHSFSSQIAARNLPATNRGEYEITTAESWDGENAKTSRRSRRAAAESYDDYNDADEDALLLLSEQMQQVKSDAFLREEQLLKRINTLEDANHGLARQRSLLEEENVELLAQLKIFHTQSPPETRLHKEQQSSVQTTQDAHHARGRRSQTTSMTLSHEAARGAARSGSNVVRDGVGIVAMPGLVSQDMEALEANYTHLFRENEKLVRYVVAMEERVRKLDADKKGAEATIAALSERVKRYALALQISADRGPQPLRYN